MLARPVLSLAEIEEDALALQREMWDNQVSLWQGLKVTPLDVCDPEMALYMLGYEYREGVVDDWGREAGRYQLAGFIDRTRRLVAVSDRYNPIIKRFTCAHELGHLRLHPGLHHHRERPLAGPTEPAEPVDPMEREANHFAGCFLVPRKVLRKAFQAYFKVDQLRLDDMVAYDICPTSHKSVLEADPRSLCFERAVAQASRYKGSNFESLAKTFRVSPTTMAIRLRQLGLVLV